jgi:transposase
VLAARIVLSEIGPDMTRFPTARHLLSWAGLCPRNDESAGKRRSNRLRKGSVWLKTLPVQCAWAARRKKGRATSIGSLVAAVRKRRPAQVAASLLTTIYHMLEDGTQFADLGVDHFDRRSKEVSAKRLVVQLAKLGFDAISTLGLRPLPKRPEISDVAIETQILPHRALLWRGRDAAAGSRLTSYSFFGDCEA